MHCVNEIVVPGNCGDNLTWEYDKKQKLLTIDGSGPMQFEQVPWKEWEGELELVLFHAACSRICAGAFRGFRNLRCVIVFGGGLKEIAESAFEDCSSLEEFDLPVNSGTGIHKVSDCAFRNCGNLKRWDTNVQIVGARAFENCTKLQFMNGCNIGTESIGEYAFANCKGISKLPMFGTGQGWFCHGESDLEVGYGLSLIPRGAFSGCEGLERIAIPCTIEKIESDAFARCQNLTEILITEETEYDRSAFARDPVIADGFGLCRSYAHGADVVCWTQKDGVLHFSGKGSIIADPDCSSWEDPCCPPWNRGIHTVIMDEGCTAIAHSTFSNERSLRRVILPSGMEAIGHYAFAGCVNLDTLHIPESVKTIDPHAFEGVPHIIYHGPARSEDNWGALSRN